jgi:hypothetical protein
MALSVPREVLERALRNQPPSSSSLPKFGTFAWRSQGLASNAATTTIPEPVPPAPEPEPIWFLPRLSVPFPITDAEDTYIYRDIQGATPVVNWTSYDLPPTPNGQPSVAFTSKLAYDGTSTFVAATLYLEKALYSNDNGVTWNYSDLISNGTDLGYITYTTLGYGNGKFIALGYDIVTSSSLTGCYSDNGGVSWNKITLPINSTWRDIAYGNGRYIVTATNTLSSVYSLDGINWTTYRQPLTGEPSIAFGDGRFIVTDDGLRVYHSTDGVNWLSAALPINESWIRSGICWTGDRFVVFGTNNTFQLGAVYSFDAIDWIYSLALSSNTPFGNYPTLATNLGSNMSIIIDVGSPLKIGFTPNNGLLWYFVPGPFDDVASDVTSWGSGNNTFIALADNLNKFAIGELVY